MEKLNIKELLSKKQVRPNSIGGQAVIEGVMMRGKKMYAMAVRGPNKSIEILKEDVHSVSDTYTFLKLPILRGVVAFVGSLVMGMKIITKSAEMAGLEAEDDDPPSKFEKFLEDKFGDKLNDYIITFSVVLSIVFSIGLFMLMPTWLASFAHGIVGTHTWIISIIEGLVRIVILIGYVYLISLSKDIKRVYQYHGAEHKTINCFESGQDLTVDNVKKNTRLHKRCGTSFLLIVMIISMIFFFFVRTETIWLRLVMRVLFVPLIAGVSYEVIRWAGRSTSGIVGIVSYPGLCLQKITTAEPDSEQIEVAIAAMKEVLAAEAPEDHITHETKQP